MMYKAFFPSIPILIPNAVDPKKGYSRKWTVNLSFLFLLVPLFSLNHFEIIKLDIGKQHSK